MSPGRNMEPQPVTRSWRPDACSRHWRRCSGAADAVRLEGLLARFAASRYREDFVLKGGVLLAAFSLRRTTNDIDLQATGISNDAADVLDRVREIATTDTGDGLAFDPRTATAHTIREDDRYAGVRILGYPLAMVSRTWEQQSR